MKKLSLGIMFLSVTLFTIYSCKKEKTLVGCTTASLNYSTAWSEYYADQTVANCEALEDALIDYIDACAPGQTYEDELAELNCSESK